MNGPGIISLDAHRSLSRRSIAVWLVALGVYLGVAVVIAGTQAEVVWPAVPSFTTAHAFALAIVNGLTGLVLWSYGVSTRQRGYLWLAGAYLYSGALLLVFPLSFPNGLLSSEPPTVLLGRFDAGPYIFVFWHLGLLAGIAVGSILLALDSRLPSSARRPVSHPRWAAVVLAGLIAATLGMVWLGGSWLPVLLEGPVPTPLFATVLDALLALTAAVTILTGLLALRRSTISIWLFAVMVVALGETIMGSVGARFSVPWYYNRIAGLAAGIILLALLARQLGRLGRAAERYAEHDALTGLMSRRTFLANLQSLVSERRGAPGRVVLLLVGLDDFKSVNDSLGHPVGDTVLIRVAGRISAAAGPGSRVGRLGSDEFGVLLVDAGRGEVADRAAAVLAEVQQPISTADTTISLTASIGATTDEDAGRVPELMISAVDLAMYAAKGAGGNQFRWFEPPMAAAAEAEAELRRSIARGLAAEEFTVDYQPIVNPSTGAPQGVEALVRWQDGDQRRLPGEFLGSAIRSGQITAIGRRVLDVVAADLDRILADRNCLDVHVNLSAVELADQDLVGVLLAKRALRHRDRLVLEVTESLSVASDTEGGRALDELREAGYRIAVDDFGSGYANLARLETMRPAIIKVDRSLVLRAASGEPWGSAFLRAALSMADALQCDLIAEGVETAAQVEAVRAMGVTSVQGFYYARPMPLGALLEWLRERPASGVPGGDRCGPSVPQQPAAEGAAAAVQRRGE